ncbi:MAG: lipase family protein [Bacteroidota bacterium]
MKTFTIIFCVFFAGQFLNAQVLKPGFDKAEYIELLKIMQKQHVDLDKWPNDTLIAKPAVSKFVYRSPVIGIANVWDLWIKDNNVAVLSVRGTVADPVSWLSNLYAAMVPAKGTLNLETNFKFHYHLADDDKANVHIGWLISAAYISRDMRPKIDSCYKAGIKEFLIMGHSQGGAICFLLTSHLERLKTEGKIGNDIRFKTYCSAGPKPGNLYYAYAYENLTKDGWGYNVINTADWVPEVPFSIQTKNDFNYTNFFLIADPMIKKQKGAGKVVAKHVYRKLTKPGLKAQRKYELYLGKMASKSVKKLIPEFEAPDYVPCNNYVRTGNTVLLFAKEDYYTQFPKVTTNIWTHHFTAPYLYLANQLPDK